MPLTEKQSLPRSGMPLTLCLVAVCLILPRLTYGQALQHQTGEPSELDSALARAGAGDADRRDVVVIAKAKAVQAIPALEQQFRRSTDPDTKASIASGLVQLKDRDDTYWNFLLEQATLAVDSDVPDPAFSQSQAKQMSNSPELQAWAGVNGISLDIAARMARYDYPDKVLSLAMTGDSRGISLLRRALKSRNYLIVIWATKGLAQIQDNESIPLIVAAAQRAPVGYAPFIAESLAFFDVAQARSAVDKLLPFDHANMIREARAGGSGVFGK